MKFKRRLQTDEEGIPITNLVDVLFLLIVFFMTSTVMSFNKGMDVNLPQTEGGGKISMKGVNVLIAADGTARVDGVTVPLSRLGEAVKERRKVVGSNVILQSDRTTQYQLIADAMDQLLLAGITDISLPVVAKDGRGVH